LKDDVIESQKLLIVYSIGFVFLLLMLIIALYIITREKWMASTKLEQLVKSRTKALELNYTLIQCSYENQLHLMNKAKSDINSLLSTAKGLGAISSIGSVMKDNTNFRLVFQSSTSRLSSIINNVGLKMSNA
jgi:hypothetical protein